MKKIALVLSVLTFLFSVTSLNAQEIEGVWKTIDDETGKPKSHVKLYKKDGKLYGKIVKILTEGREDAKCTECEDEKKDQPIMGMEIVTELSYDADDNEWEDGEILDPNNGTYYDCKMWLDEDNPDKLNVRGYVLFMYRTQYWYRVK